MTLPDRSSDRALDRPLNRPTVLIHRPGSTDGRWLSFRRPLDVLVAQTPVEVPDLLSELRQAVGRGRWAAGFLSYEATPAFDPAFASHPPESDVPAAWWALFDEPERLDALPEWHQTPTDDDVPDLDWRPLVGREDHARSVAEVRRRIAEGDTYQVNLTFPLEAEIPPGVDPYQLFQRWVSDGTTPPYATFIDTDDQLCVASVSPELFFSLDGRELRARPMKGTSPRGRWLEEDAARRAELLSEKNRAENLMIADMLRNDLGRVAVPGSVRVVRLFGFETYATVHQLVSEVAARLEPGRDALDVLRALFPCASITGAPKARTSHIIRQLEPHRRGVYTGSAGYFAPDGSAQLNVLIRTASFHRSRRIARYGTGGGVVWDSDAESEFREAGTKTRLLRRPASRPGEFRLLETMLWRGRSGYFLLDHHLRRLAESAGFFGFCVDVDAIRRDLERRAADWAERTRVRLLVQRDGAFSVESRSEPCPGRSTLRIALDDRPVDDQDVFLFHKTTRRAVYNEALARHPGADDVLLWNDRGELTESTRANVFVELNGRRLTPPRACGLLAGTYRQALLERGSLEERVLTRHDLARADRILLVNSVRGVQPVGEILVEGGTTL